MLYRVTDVVQGNRCCTGCAIILSISALALYLILNSPANAASRDTCQPHDWTLWMSRPGTFISVLDSLGNVEISFYIPLSKIVKRKKRTSIK